MARISVDMNQITKNLKETAEKARVQLTELAQRLEKDLGDKQVVQKLREQGLKLAARAGETATELRKEIEKRLGKNSDEIIESVKAKVAETAEEVKKSVTSKTKSAAKKTAKKTEPNA